ncbi:hypothetical protein Droror1_Dr00019585 [Drosera rotundifolia]
MWTTETKSAAHRTRRGKSKKIERWVKTLVPVQPPPFPGVLHSPAAFSVTSLRRRSLPRASQGPPLPSQCIPSAPPPFGDQPPSATRRFHSRRVHITVYYCRRGKWKGEEARSKSRKPRNLFAAEPHPSPTGLAIVREKEARPAAFFHKARPMSTQQPQVF